MNWTQWFATCVILGCLSWGSIMAEYSRDLFCERLRLSVVNFVGDDFDVYNKLLFEHSVFIYKRLCLHQNVSPHGFLLDELMNDENVAGDEYDTLPVGGRHPADILNHDRNLWFQNYKKQHWFEKEL